MKQSLTTLKNWVKELKQLGPDNIVIAIAGNKSDLEDKRVRAFSFNDIRALLIAVPLQEVPATQAKAYADEIGALFIETSAKEDTNVSDMFIQLSKALPSATESNALPEIVDPYGGGKQKSGGCC